MNPAIGPKVTGAPFSLAMAQANWQLRKSMTRRVAKLTESGRVKKPGRSTNWHPNDSTAVLACPYGQPGDLIYQREPWFTTPEFDDLSPAQLVEHFAAINARPPILLESAEMWVDWPAGVKPSCERGRYRHAKFMPRVLTQATLRITEVRLERVQAITAADVHREGVQIPCSEPGRPLLRLTGPFPPAQYVTRDPASWTPDDYARAEFASLWDSINAARGKGWNANPLTWVIGYEFIPRNVDTVLAEQEDA